MYGLFKKITLKITALVVLINHEYHFYVILSITGIVIFTILLLIVTLIMYYTIGFFVGFIEAVEDFINTRK